VLDDIPDPEVIVGIVGAVGIDTHTVVGVLTDVLREHGYDAEEIRLSHLLHTLDRYKHLKEPSAPEDERIDAHMDAGDELRERVRRGDALALLAIAAVRRARVERQSEPNRPLKRQAYILNSLKHPEEVNTLRKVYGKPFLLISVYSPRPTRIEVLAERIASSKYTQDKGRYRQVAERLVERDMNSGDTGNEPFGQDVGNAFPLADVFVRMGDRERLKSDLGRVIETWFGYPFHTPTPDELGMFHAKAAALRSADLSRQVGAVICSVGGELLATGCNEVPKAGGGAIWEGDTGDYRDFKLGYDSSAKMKHELIAEVINRLQGAGWLSETKAKSTVEGLVSELLYEGAKVMKGARVTNIIEFGRIVHAEMAAVTDAARRGLPLSGTTLYCTTFPCHMCARHILAAGIQRVVYIEPYPKSLAKDLYPQAIAVEGTDADPNAVRFDPFVGVSPTRYIEFFSYRPRKNSHGAVLPWDRTSSHPKFESVYLSYIDAEVAVENFINHNATLFGIAQG
jgi:cytidine deaminase